ncbi:unnamed protein product [Prorocentrum cordatum]|uniref:Ion transport domain-containing protein n=1 Tax=Prorocentrum cordatum TaxID=2364126 RepID=A0ABN9YH71_9DINO|nr:unnamed protein product [Polarella glacialis]
MSDHPHVPEPPELVEVLLADEPAPPPPRELLRAGSDPPVGPLLAGVERRLAEQLDRLEGKVEHLIGVSSQSRRATARRATARRSLFAGIMAEMADEERAEAEAAQVALAKRVEAAKKGEVARRSEAARKSFAELRGAASGGRASRAGALRKWSNWAVPLPGGSEGEVLREWSESCAEVRPAGTSSTVVSDEDGAEGPAGSGRPAEPAQAAHCPVSTLAERSGPEGAGGRPERARAVALEDRAMMKPALRQGTDLGGRVSEIEAPPEGAGGTRRQVPTEAAQGVAPARRPTLKQKPGQRQTWPELREAAQEEVPQRKGPAVVVSASSPCSTSDVVGPAPQGCAWAGSPGASSPKRVGFSQARKNCSMSHEQLSSKMSTAEGILNMMEKTEKGRRTQSVHVRGSQFARQTLEKRVRLLKHATTLKSGRVKKVGVVGKVVSSNAFDYFIMLIVFLNLLLIGAQVNHAAVSDRNEQAFDIMEYVCTFIFAVELCARLSVYRVQFFTHFRERWWNIFDFLLVGISLIDTAISLGVDTKGGTWGFMGNLGRAIRLLRIMRIFRVVRRLAQLRVMLYMIISSLQSCFWVLIIMVGVIYMVAIVVTQGATEFLRGPNAAVATDEYEQVLSMYGSLFSTMYTLFLCMSGGISWGLASKPMRGPGWLLEAVVIGYVFFMVFAVANIQRPSVHPATVLGLWVRTHWKRSQHLSPARVYLLAVWVLRTVSDQSAHPNMPFSTYLSHGGGS